MERFVTCARGCEHWGAHGAAGVLLRTPDDLYLLVQRGLRTHQGGMWSVPGGAALPGESALEAALREADEEIGPLPVVTVLGEHQDDHGGWRYVTVVAQVSEPFEPAQLSWETEMVRWVSAQEAAQLPLHPGLRAAWPALLDRGLVGQGWVASEPA